MPDLKLMIYSPEDEYEECSRFWIKLGKLERIFKLPPWLLPGKLVTRTYQSGTYKELVQRAYGFWYSAEDYFLQIHYGLQDESGDLGDRKIRKTWCWTIPWLAYDMVAHRYYYLDWTEFKKVPALKTWAEERATYPRCWFKIQDADGEIIQASGYLEEREWRRGLGWWKWVGKFTNPIIRPVIDITYEEEVGAAKGSWKGGMLGHSIDVDKTKSIVDNLAAGYQNSPHYNYIKLLPESYSTTRTSSPISTSLDKA
jgi:hypothetical protein